jgi:hypothetical protein
MVKRPISGICKALGLNRNPGPFHASASQSRTIAAQIIEIRTHVVVSTPPNKIVEKIGNRHSKKKIIELM